MAGRFSTINVRWRVVLYFLPAAVWAGVLLAVAVAPDLGALEEVEVVPQQDKLEHFLGFVLLAVLVYIALDRGTGRSTEWRFRASSLGSTVYGVALELLQLLIPYRSAEMLDFVADAFGATVGAVGAMFFLEWYRSRKG